MNQSTLEKAKGLETRIQNLKSYIDQWEGSKKIRVGVINIDGRVVREIDFVDEIFTDFKKMYLAKLYEQLQKAEHEFKCL